MKKLIIPILLLLSQTTFAQANKNVSIFHRLLIYNDNQELMIVKFKDTDIWVTPGFYQDSLQFIKKGLHDIASDYGITISDPELKGTFSLRSETNGKTSMSIRNMYKSNYLNGQVKIPAFLGDVKWLPIEEALKTLTYPHINLFIKQTYDYPDVVWGGSLARMKEGDKWETKIMDEFHPIFNNTKQSTNNKLDSLTLEDLQAYSHPFTIENGEFKGKGATILTQAIANAHITMLGDNTRSSLESNFTHALINELDRLDYKTMVVETGRSSGNIINRLSEIPEQTIPNLKALNQKYALVRKGIHLTPIPDFKSIEAAQYLQSARERDWSIHAIGIESWTSYKMLANELYNNLSKANQKEHQPLYQEVLTLLDQLYLEVNRQNNEELLQFTSSLKSSEEFNEFIEKMGIYHQNLPIIDGLKFSIDYWWMYGNRDFYTKNKLDAKRNKVQLAATLKSHQFNFQKDKLFLKMYVAHLAKGTTVSGFFGVGNMLQEMGDYHGHTTINIAMARRFYEEDNTLKDLMNAPNFYRANFKELVPLGKQEEWILIDLRPFNKAFYWGPYLLSTAMHKILERYDFLVIPKTDKPPTTNY